MALYFLLYALLSTPYKILNRNNANNAYLFTLSVYNKLYTSTMLLLSTLEDDSFQAADDKKN